MRSVPFRSSRVGILFKYKLISLGESMHPCLTPLHHESGLNARKQLLHNFYTSSIFRKILNIFKYCNKILIFETATLFFVLNQRLSFFRE